ncbi:SDR family oxidoreductase [Oceanobacillus sojae]|nr:SDR family oxidoreductase [Oceanobacillus sojae]
MCTTEGLEKDIGLVAVFLTSEDSKYMTGKTLMGEVLKFIDFKGDVFS